VDTGQVVESPSARARVRRVSAIIRREPLVGGVLSFYTTGDRSFVARDGRSTYLAVAFRPAFTNDLRDAAERVQGRLAGLPGIRVGGPEVVSNELSDQVAKDLARAEMLALPLVFLLSLLVFRGVVAALLPLAAGALAILGTFLALRVVNELTPLSVFALNLTTGLGLGLAIDYSLFVVSRYREELERVGPGHLALRRTLATAGRTVAFSSLTVGAAMASLLVFPQPFLYSMGIGGIFVAVFSALAALVVLPAILAVLGTRVNALAPARLRRRPPDAPQTGSRGFWATFSPWVMRRAVPVALASAAVMIALGLPFLHARWIGVDETVLPAHAGARQAGAELASSFAPNRTSPVVVVATAPPSSAREVAAFAGRLRALPEAAAVRGPRLVGADTWRIDVVSRHAALAGASKRLVRDIRSLDAGFPVAAGGQTASYIDQLDSVRRRLPLALLIVVSTTVLLLFAMTGSVLLPIKAVVMNVLTLSATFGILVLVFQDGRFEGLLGYDGQGALNFTQPILVGAVGFALSTDYGVFLLTRIKEAADAGLPTTDAVAAGLERTGRIVTAAALLFTVAVGAFATSSVVFIKELGLGMVLAVLIDATIVRALLVPSLMRVMGRWNWWAPRPLRRAHERFGLREVERAAPTFAK